MKKPRTGSQGAATKPSLQPGDDWQKWSTELPPATLVLLKVRAAQERRAMREVLQDAITAYVNTAVR
jgi:hypothetical protein